LRSGAVTLGALLAGCAPIAAPRAPASKPEVAPAPAPVAVAEALTHPDAKAEPPAAPPSLAVGLYRCDLQRSVAVRWIAPDLGSIVLDWLGQDHSLRSTPTSSGALRYEDPKSGLTWLVISGKSMLLDSRRGRQLANECRP